MSYNMSISRIANQVKLEEKLGSCVVGKDFQKFSVAAITKLLFEVWCSDLFKSLSNFFHDFPFTPPYSLQHTFIHTLILTGNINLNIKN